MLGARTAAGAVVFTLPLLALGCAHPIGKRLRTAADGGAIPADLVVVYDDHHPTWGGSRVRVGGDREVEVRRWRPGQTRQQGTSWTGQTTDGRLRELVALLVRIEAWEHRSQGRPPRLYEHRAQLVIRVGGESRRIWEWANDLQANQRLVLVKDLLDALVRRAGERRTRAEASRGAGAP